VLADRLVGAQADQPLGDRIDGHHLAGLVDDDDTARHLVKLER
jgi:hypothetical protein